jgi:hypothetical protein
MNLKIREQPADQSDQPKILHDHGVYSAINGVSQKIKRLCYFLCLYQRVQGEVDTTRPLMRQSACGLEFRQRELGPFVAGIEAPRTQVDRVGAIGYCGTH